MIDFQEVYGFQQIIIAMESASMYIFHPAIFFYQDKKLKTLNIVVTIKHSFCINQFSRTSD